MAVGGGSCFPSCRSRPLLTTPSHCLSPFLLSTPTLHDPWLYFFVRLPVLNGREVCSYSVTSYTCLPQPCGPSANYSGSLLQSSFSARYLFNNCHVLCCPFVAHSTTVRILPSLSFFTLMASSADSVPQSRAAPPRPLPTLAAWRLCSSALFHIHQFQQRLITQLVATRSTSNLSAHTVNSTSLGSIQYAATNHNLITQSYESYRSVRRSYSSFFY